MATYDRHGWYAGDSFPGRDAPAPQNTSTTTTPGQQRANWTGYAWVDLPYVAPVADTPPVPAAVTMRQGRDALILAGLDDDVDAAIDAIPDALTRKRARNAWENSNDFERHNGFISMLGPAIGLSDAEIDQLFITAATL